MSRPPYGMLSILMIGAFLSLLNNTLLNIALPSIMSELHVEASTVQWLTTGYMLVNGILIPTTAYLIQKYSVRQLFLSAMGIFTIGSLLAATAPAFSLLLAGRMTQAAGSAIMMPLLMNVMLVSFPIDKRGTAMGVFGLIMMGAPAIGPTLSGWLIEHYDWRMLFYVVTPVAVAVFAIGIFLLKDKKGKVDLHLDTVSVVLSTIGFGGLLYGFSSAGKEGWASPQVYGTILLGIAAITIFILRQSKREQPMLNFAIFKYPMYTLSITISMVITMALFSGMVLMPIYVQTIRGISPLDAGLMMMPGAIIMALMSPVTGKLFDKYGGRTLAIVGLSLLTVTSYLLARLTLETTYTYLVVLYSVRMLGMSMVMMPVSTNGLNQLPKRFYPHGTAMNNTMQQVSGAIGTALLVTVMSNQTKTHAAELVRAGQGGMTEEVMIKAMLEGINDAFFVSVFIAGLGLVLSFFIKRAKPAEDLRERDTNDEQMTPKVANS
ncbi:MDR family MFS transporter [Ammoniphilus sp. YIM 78166]|uniref:MDR family MFS transporter n=1 Tax=Ammoniphilus sp. YIM 78166 TaxID=1644106 RepID=UPI00106F57E5|nr:MDR family MFS transporter [Ammoniphilus sp. YIM 78166]